MNRTVLLSLLGILAIPGASFAASAKTAAPVAQKPAKAVKKASVKKVNARATKAPQASSQGQKAASK